jgi:hypothetical protein
VRRHPRTADPARPSQRLEDLDAKILKLDAETRDRMPSEAENETFDELMAERDTVWPEYEKLEQKAKRIEEVRARTFSEISGLPSPRKSVDELFEKSVSRMQYREARDGALRILDDKESNYVLNTRQIDGLEQRSARTWTRRVASSSRKTTTTGRRSTR